MRIASSNPNARMRQWRFFFSVVISIEIGWIFMQKNVSGQKTEREKKRRNIQTAKEKILDDENCMNASRSNPKIAWILVDSDFRMKILHAHTNTDQSVAHLFFSHSHVEQKKDPIIKP